MTTPIAVAEEYIPMIDYSVVVGTTSASWTATLSGGMLTHAWDTDDMTNNADAGAYSDVKTTYSWEGDIELVYKLSSPPPMNAGDIFPVAITGPTGTPSVTGNFRFNSFGHPFFDPKKGYKIGAKIKSQGAVVKGVSA